MCGTSKHRMVLGDGPVATWEHARRGGDGNAVQVPLKQVQHIQANLRAFAATLVDGFVVTWGDSDAREQPASRTWPLATLSTSPMATASTT